MKLLTPLLLAFLTLSSLSAGAADPAAPQPDAPPAWMPSKTAASSTDTAEGMDAESLARANEDFEAMVKQDLKQMEADLKETTKSINALYASETELEERLHQKKLAFRKDMRDARVAFEKSSIEAWKTLMKRLHDVSPAERATEKIDFDQKSTEDRRKFNDASSAKSLKFLEEQNDERHRYWTEVQKSASETRRVAREHETKWGKSSTAR